ncbi:MAG: LysM peptidoglycan-binding domain-containing protein [Caldilineales bacterium]|nr:LysM peptidoglycan-binding domain-containing protein [Caldilineales bacterium]
MKTLDIPTPRHRYAATMLVVLLIALSIGGCRSRSASDSLSADASATPATPAKPTAAAPQARITTATAQPTTTPKPTATVTPTATLTQPVAPTPGPTVSPDVAQEFSRVQPNQFLGEIAARYGVTVDAIAAASGIEDPNIVAQNQRIIIPHQASRTTPADILIPDSEVVYGPAYVDFDTAAFLAQYDGKLSHFTMQAPNGETWTAADLIDRVAKRYSIGPRVLLAFMEARSGWVTNPEPEGIAADYPLGHTMGAGGLLSQLEWAANALGDGFYGWLDRGETAIRFRDGVVTRGHPDLNPGTMAVLKAISVDRQWRQLEAEITAFSQAYVKLFGDPFALDAGPILPAGLTQPVMHLPWQPGEQWYMTSGPHGGWLSGSGWAALDFVPETAPPGSCVPANTWAVAAAPGIVARNDNGEVLIDLDGDGDIRTGWILQYLHMEDAVPAGTILKAGDAVGRPSCAGGSAASAHLHIARRYNGVWVAASGWIPFTLDGWQATGRFEYEGGLEKDGLAPLTACDCRIEDFNAVPVGDAGDDSNAAFQP